VARLEAAAEAALVLAAKTANQDLMRIPWQQQA